MKTKAELLQEFQLLQGVEQSAGDFYRRVAPELPLAAEKARETFLAIAKDEDRHVEIVQKILNIIQNTL